MCGSVKFFQYGRLFGNFIDIQLCLARSIWIQTLFEKMQDGSLFGVPAESKMAAFSWNFIGIQLCISNMSGSKHYLIKSIMVASFGLFTIIQDFLYLNEISL